MKKENIVDFLAGMPLFASCGREFLDEMLDSGCYWVKHRNKGEYVNHAGEPCSAVTVLLKGFANACMIGDNGKELVVESFQAPDILAPAFLFGENREYPVDIVARTKCSFLYIDKEAFVELLHSNKAIMLSFMAILSDKCHNLSHRVRMFALMPLNERVINYLKANKKAASIQALSRTLAVTRPSLSRLVSQLKSAGVVEITEEGIVLCHKKH